MYHNTLLYCKDINTTHVMLTLNHMYYEVNADGSKDNSACGQRSGSEESRQYCLWEKIVLT